MLARLSKLIDDFLFTRKGVVESIDLTFGSRGNQWMVIDGKRYATWIDFSQWPKIGSTVRHRPYKDTYYSFGAYQTMLCTTIVED